jgi:hypothetical protein
MPLNRTILADITVDSGPFIGLRHSLPLNNALQLAPLSVTPGSGRWNTPDGTLYTASSQVVAWAEFCRWFWRDIADAAPTAARHIDAGELTRIGSQALGQEVPVRSIYEIRGSLQRLADLTDPANQAYLHLAGFPLEHFLTNTPDDYGLCPEVARIGEELGWDALRTPSAAWPEDGYTIAIFAAGRLGISSCRVVFEGRPTVAMAVATRYRDGQKPGWIP